MSSKILTNSQIRLDPYVKISAKEKWLFDNKAALAQLKQGLKEIK